MGDGIHVEARFHSGDIHAEAGRDGVTLTMHGDQEHAYADFDWNAAHKLGEWLVAQALVHGVTPLGGPKPEPGAAAAEPSPRV
ncbi:hypothetical protein [Methylobacterium sp. CM6257]|jgi:hypothetical protein